MWVLTQLESVAHAIEIATNLTSDVLLCFCVVNNNTKERETTARLSESYHIEGKPGECYKKTKSDQPIPLSSW